MFIAMNRFRVVRGSEAAFEKLWRDRRSRLHDQPGLISFHLLRGPEREGHTLYASHTVWQNRGAFTAWGKSAAFRAAHQGAGDSEILTLGPPELEDFEAVAGTTIDARR